MRRLAVTVLCALGMSSFGGVPAAAEDEFSVPEQSHVLGVTSFSDILVDDAHGHVFVTDGSGGGLLVRDLDGNALLTIDNMPGASTMALSPDGSTLYVALRYGDAIAAIDTTTLVEQARYETGSQTCPGSLAATATRVWFGYTCQGSWGGIGVVDLTADPPVVVLDRTPTSIASTGARLHDPQLLISPAEPDRMIVSEYRISSGDLWSFAIDGIELTVLASGRADSPVIDFALTPDGEHVLVSGGGDYQPQRYRVSDFSGSGGYGTAYPQGNSVDVSGGGFVASGLRTSGRDVRTYTESGTLIRTYELSNVSGDVMAEGGLAFNANGTRLYAVAINTSAEGITLYVLGEPTRADCAITLSAPATAQVGTPFTLTGTLTWPSTVPVGTIVHVTRSHEGDTIVLPDEETGPNGTFSFDDAVPEQGTFTYEVRFDGDAVREPATAQDTVVATRHASAITLTAPAVATAGAEHVLTGSLTSDAPVAPGTAVHVVRSNESGSVSLPDSTTGSNGAFQVRDTPPIRGSHTYVASWDGDAAHSPANDDVTFDVAGRTPVLTITTDARAYSYGRIASVALHLGPTASNRTARIYATPYGQPAVLIKEGEVDANGDLFVTRTMTRSTTFTAWFGGDEQYRPHTVTRAVTSGVRVTERLSGYYRTQGGYAYYRTSADPTLNVSVAPRRHGACMTYEAQIYSSGAWRSVQKNTCIRLDSNSRIAPKMTATPRTGYAYRVRTTFNGDSANTKTYGAWLYFKFG